MESARDRSALSDDPQPPSDDRRPPQGSLSLSRRNLICPSTAKRVQWSRPGPSVPSDDPSATVMTRGHPRWPLALQHPAGRALIPLGSARRLQRQWRCSQSGDEHEDEMDPGPAWALSEEAAQAGAVRYQVRTVQPFEGYYPPLPMLGALVVLVRPGTGWDRP